MGKKLRRDHNSGEAEDLGNTKINKKQKFYLFSNDLAVCMKFIKITMMRHNAHRSGLVCLGYQLKKINKS